MSSRCGAWIHGKPFAQRGDHLARLADRQRRLRHVGELGARGKLERRHVVARLHQQDRLGDLAHRSDDLLVAGVTDQDHREAVARVAAGLDVHLGDQRAGRVDRAQPACLRACVDGGSDPVGREHHRLTLGHLGLVVDEDRAAFLELAHDVEVVDDLLADVDRCAIQRERLLDGVNGPLDTGAVAARRGEENLLDHPQRSVARELRKPAARGVGAAGFPKMLATPVSDTADDVHRPVHGER